MGVLHAGNAREFGASGQSTAMLLQGFPRHSADKYENAFATVYPLH